MYVIEKRFPYFLSNFVTFLVFMYDRKEFSARHLRKLILHRNALEHFRQRPIMQLLL